MISDVPTFPSAVQAIKLGSFDYVPKNRNLEEEIKSGRFRKDLIFV